ncbi:uncharacterized protein LOC133844246 [Drosophila sulfurigaster albostrigata]|uniref:uncharacterized protein LOC133844246 n=1 Tax=Drosophila sulfurigaster albostrigata TaxID=89887 RepID=UPI002D21EA06|nr:uncharacterized protein LOC133844246 [Drosophila sulfurigaster albostrigata]
MFVKFMCKQLSTISSPRKFNNLLRYPNTAWLQQRKISYHNPRRRGVRLALVQWINGLRTRYCMWKLKRLFAPNFDELDFLFGARQAATMIIKAVHESDWNRIRSCCTDQGSCAIYSLCQSQRNIHYSKLLRFESQHLCQVSPTLVKKQCEDGRTFVYVNLVFVGLRNMRDFATQNEQQEMLQLMRQVLEQSQIPDQKLIIQQRIVLSQFALTLRRELKQSESDPQEWLVDFYKVFGFKLVNYSPVTLEYRVIEIVKPV